VEAVFILVAVLISTLCSGVHCEAERPALITFMTELLMLNEIASVETFMARLVAHVPKAHRNITITFRDEPRQFSISVKVGKKYFIGTGESIIDAMKAFIETALFE
jgi:hypothetical protein